MCEKRWFSLSKIDFDSFLLDLLKVYLLLLRLLLPFDKLLPFFLSHKSILESTNFRLDSLLKTKVEDCEGFIVVLEVVCLDLSSLLACELYFIQLLRLMSKVFL